MIAAGSWKEAGSIASRLYDGGVAETRRREFTPAGIVSAVAGVALFVWLVWHVGPREVVTGFCQIGWWLLAILLLGGLRFAMRAWAWTLSIEPPHRLRFADAFVAAVCGDAVGNLTPLGPVVGEPAKVAYVRDRIPLRVAFTALAIENVFYTLSVAGMIAAGTLALLVTVDLPLRVREFSEVAVGAIVVLFLGVAWLLWKQPALVGARREKGSAGTKMQSRLERLRAIEQDVYTFASRRRGVVLPISLAELAFHVLGVAEKHLTLWLILGAAPPLVYSFIVETADRMVTVAFKFVPFQFGVGEAGGGAITALLGMGTDPGVTLQVVRKARMGIWSLIGMVFLVRHGLSARRILEDKALQASPRS
jgi:hypothetical protein